MTTTRTSPLALAALGVALLALLVAVGSTSYAVGLKRNTVGTPQLRKDAVTSAKIRDGAVGRTDLAPGLAQPVTVDVTRTVEPGQQQTVARVGGIAYVGDCALGGGGVVVRAQLAISPVAVGAPPGSISGVYTSTVDDTDGEFSESSGSGVVSSAGLVAFGDGSTEGRASLSGLLQYARLPANRVDLGMTATTEGGPACRFRVVATPTR